MIRLANVRHEYRFGVERVHALGGVSLEIAERDFIALVGPSGSGKSTLLHVIGGLLRPTEGDVEVAGQRPFALPDAERSRFRNRTIGFVFQFFHLMPYYSAVENVGLPLVVAEVEPAERRRRACEALAAVGMAHRERHRPGQLSGGELQRVSIARAIAAGPKVLLADEPTGNLDRAATDAVMALLDELRERLGLTIVLVTHNERVAARAGRIVHLDRGEVVHDGR